MDLSFTDDLQDISDVVLYASHVDPQLKGNTASLLGGLIHSTLQQSRGHFHRWVAMNSDRGEVCLYSDCVMVQGSKL